MKKQVTNLKCPNCDNGIIVMTAKKTALETTFDVKDCNVFGSFYGLKACKDLYAITKLL